MKRRDGPDDRHAQIRPPRGGGGRHVELRKVPLSCPASADRAVQAARTSMRVGRRAGRRRRRGFDRRNQAPIAEAGCPREGRQPGRQAAGERRGPRPAQRGRHAWGIGAALEAEDPHTETEVRDARRAGQASTRPAHSWFHRHGAAEWHDSARFSESTARRRSRSRRLVAVNAANGTRRPPVSTRVICLVDDGDDRAVLVRQTVWPERLFSLPAGSSRP